MQAGVPAIPITVNSDMTAFAAGVLNGVPECTDATATTIEFRTDGTLWFSCNGDDAAQSGTWERDDTAGTVTLSIAPTTAIPTGLALVIADFTVNAATLSGTVAGFPLPNDVTMDLSATNLQLVTTSVVLAKQP